MKNTIIVTILFALLAQPIFAQHRITKKSLDLISQNLKSDPLLTEDDEDFKVVASSPKWSNEGAVILSQKTSFTFDKKGKSVGKIVGNNILGILLAIPSVGTSLILANQNSGHTKMIVEECERRKILLNDKFSIERYSVLYFRLSDERDAFAARVIKKDGTKHEIDLSDAVKLDNSSVVPGLFRSYTDLKISSFYRPVFYKLAVSGLEEGDILEYEFRNINYRESRINPSYKEFTPIYYSCRRAMPVVKQVVEVITENDNYYLAYKSTKGAPDFAVTQKSGMKVYRWVDENRDKVEDVRFLKEYVSLPVMKFQVSYVRGGGKKLMWFKDEEELKKDMTAEEFAEKAKVLWFSPSKVINVGWTDDNTTVEREFAKFIKGHDLMNSSEDQYVRILYYYIRSKTMYAPCSDYDFSKLFSYLLKKRNIPHEVIVSPYNSLTDIAKLAFVSEVGWAVYYKDKLYCNPDDHLNPGEVSVNFDGNEVVRFNPDNSKQEMKPDHLVLSDTIDNNMSIDISCSLADVTKPVVVLEKSCEATGLMKAAIIDDILAYTPYMESDYKNYNGMSMWDGLSEKDAEKARSELNHLKTEWKTDKPEMMKEMANSIYEVPVEKYTAFRLLEDGRSFKKNKLRYQEKFSLTEMTSYAGDDIMLRLPALIGMQSKVRKEERNRTMPVDFYFAKSTTWNIDFAIPAGYTLKGWEALNMNIDNESAAFVSTAKIENNVLSIEVRKTYKIPHVEAAKWNDILQVLDAAYNFSQMKVLLQKQ